MEPAGQCRENIPAHHHGPRYEGFPICLRIDRTGGRRRTSMRPGADDPGFPPIPLRAKEGIVLVLFGGKQHSATGRRGGASRLQSDLQ